MRVYIGQSRGRKMNAILTGLENPTAESLAWWIYWRLHDHMPLVKVTVLETRHSITRRHLTGRRINSQ